MPDLSCPSALPRHEEIIVLQILDGFIYPIYEIREADLWLGREPCFWATIMACGTTDECTTFAAIDEHKDDEAVTSDIAEWLPYVGMGELDGSINDKSQCRCATWKGDSVRGRFIRKLEEGTRKRRMRSEIESGGEGKNREIGKRWRPNREKV